MLGREGGIRRVLGLSLLVVMGLAFVSVPGSDARDLDKGAQARGSLAAFGGTQMLERGSAPIQVLKSDKESIVLEFRIADYELSRREINGRAYDVLTASGFSYGGAPGGPQLPVASTLIGVPPGANIDLTVLQTETESLPGSYRLLPVPQSLVEPVLPPGEGPSLRYAGKSYVEDPQVYGGVAAFPASAVELGPEQMLRGLRVIAVRFFPFQYRPAGGQLTLTRRLVVEVRFSARQGGVGISSAKQDDRFFQATMAGAIANYDTAQAWTTRGTWVLDSGGPPYLYDGVPDFKVMVTRDGIYRLSRAELKAAGMDVVGVDPRTLRLYDRGEEVAIHVPGEADGSFDSQDFVEFYGRQRDSRYGDEHVYWLTYGTTLGKRMSTQDGTPSAGVAPDSFDALSRFKEQNYYVSQHSEDGDHWYWDYLYAYSGPVTKTFGVELHNLSAKPYTVAMTLTLQGIRDIGLGPDHHAVVYLNGAQVADTVWEGADENVVRASFSQAALVEGLNQIEIVAPRDLQSYDFFYVGSIQIAYLDTFVAEDDKLAFQYTGPGDWLFAVGGFQARPLEYLFDITDPLTPQRILNPDLVDQGGLWSLAFGYSIIEPRRFLVVSPLQVLTVDGIERDVASNWRDPSRGADYVVITHQDFYTDVLPLATYRESRGFRVEVVPVNDIYDEFGYGMLDAQAIHDFLFYALEHWSGPPPSYVLLVGDGHFDFKDAYGTGVGNYIPPYLADVDPWLGETAADNCYVSVACGKELPQMHLGRFPVNSSVEAGRMALRTIGYEDDPPSGVWNSQITFVADDADSAGDFAALSDDLVDNYLPDVYAPKKVYYKVTHGTEGAVRSAIVNGINDGRLLVNYIGHAAIYQWASPRLFGLQEVAQLTNDTIFPVMLPMTCFDGYFHSPFYDSLSETLVRAEGKGAVASWAPSGLGVATGHDVLNKGFFSGLFRDDIRQLGPLAYLGKVDLYSGGANLDLLDTYGILGDPALHINALDPDLQLTKTVEPGGQVDAGDVLTYTLTFTNSGQATAHHVELVDLLDPLLVSPTVVYATPGMLVPRPGVTYAWDVADLEVGDQGQIQFRAVVSPTTGPDVIVNRAELNSPASSAVATVTTGIQVPDLYVAKTGPLTVTSGQVITYSIAWGNSGATGAPNARLTDVLPPGVNYVGDSSGWSRREPTPGTLVWDMAPNPLPAGAHGTFVITGRVSAGQGLVGPLVNRVRVESDLPDADPGNNRAEWSTHLRLFRYYLPLAYPWW